MMTPKTDSTELDKYIIGQMKQKSVAISALRRIYAAPLLKT